MTRAYVGLGSNVDPETNIRVAVRLLAERVYVVALSTFYRTESVPSGAPAFINGALALETHRQALALKREVLRYVEERLGRKRTPDKNAPRTIDCDLLVYGDEVTHDPELVLPSSDIEEHPFVSIPLIEIAPDLVLPGSRRRLIDVCASVSLHAMLPLPELTDAVRRELQEVSHEPCSDRNSHPTAPR